METNVVARIEVLESELHRWKGITLILTLALVAILGMAAAPVVLRQSENSMPFDRGFVQQMPAPELAAHNFSLVGRDGKTYAQLTTRQGVPALEFYDSQGNLTWSAPPKHGLVPVGEKPVRK